MASSSRKAVVPVASWVRVWSIRSPISAPASSLPAARWAARIFSGYADVAIEGPIPADTLFHRAAQGEFDAVLSLYHDQGLTPIKLLGFGEAANVTLGLPFIRTSVDHGTAYEIAGRGCARPDSMIAAIRWALRLKSKS